jgi:hypothetical protein
MLDYLILKQKKNLTVKYDDGTKEQYIDLLTPTATSGLERWGEVIIVNEHYVARPDLISLVMYGDEAYADIICKYNGISNPFELNEDDVLIIPQLFELETFLQNGKVSEMIDSKNSKNQKISKTNKLKYQKFKDEKRSPAESVVGDKNFVIDKSLGMVFY